MWKRFKNWPTKSIRKIILRHMGGSCTRAQIIKHEIKPIERVNLQLALEQWLQQEKDSAEVLGYAHRDVVFQDGLAQLQRSRWTVVAPVEREQLLRAPCVEIDCVTRGLFLLHFEGKPIVLLLRPPEFNAHLPRLEVMAQEREVAQVALSRLLNEANRNIVYKGKTLYLEKSEGLCPQICVRFRELPPVSREEIVLPEVVLTAIERNVLGLLKHRELLRQSGRSTRHGLLFHGPPGTGKTLILRYLAKACPEHTIILISGREMQLIREPCELAWLLAPSLVFLEDVDLVAENRERNRCSDLLHELMDEMDGLGPKADCIFLLTTNRPDVLEPALAARPGRIDQAIEFPLPDEDCRHRLFMLYGRGLDMTTIDLERWIDKTRGASPAFLEEFLRKAALLAAERGETSSPPRLQEWDMERALAELIYFGGELTQKLLGYRTFGFKPREPQV